MALLMEIKKAEHSNSFCHICKKRIKKGETMAIWDWDQFKTHKKCDKDIK